MTARGSTELRTFRRLHVDVDVDLDRGLPWSPEPTPARADLRVDRAALTAAVALLDARGPANWRDRVDVRRLDMRDSTRCLLGQVYGDFFVGTGVLYSNVPVGLGSFRAFRGSFPVTLWVEYLRAHRSSTAADRTREKL